MQQTLQRKPIYNRLRNLLPSPGNVIFTVFMIGITLWAQGAGAITLGAASQEMNNGIPYQGYLTDDEDQPLDGELDMTFRLYAQPDGGSPIWTEQRTNANKVEIDQGLFTVRLGDVNTIPNSVRGDHDELYLGITLEADGELQPRVRVDSVNWGGDSNVNSFMIQNGTVARNVNNSDWSLDKGTGLRTYHVYVPFEKEFEKVPNIAVSLPTVDVNIRLTVGPTNITTEGFDVAFTTWSDGIVLGGRASWIAYTLPSNE